MFEENKIKLDFDNMKEGKRALRIFKILKIQGRYRVSSSKRGLHFELLVKNHTKKENWIIRYILGDCYGRLRADMRRLQNGLCEFDILFSEKNNKRAGKWKQIK